MQDMFDDLMVNMYKIKCKASSSKIVLYEKIDAVNNILKMPFNLNTIDVSNEIKQVVILSARPKELLETLSYIEKYITFINEVVICCPEKLVNEIKQYNGVLKLLFITDEELLKNINLPNDHAERNFLLRCLSMYSEQVDEQFLMYDDDYHPLVDIEISDFIVNGKYKAYYCYDLESWIGTSEAPTSYDKAMFRTKEFLKQEGYSTMQYSAHMPQVINKKIFLELLSNYPEIQHSAYDEWSIYFNYAITKYPHIFISEKFKTLCWPALPTDWEMQYIPDEYLFENYYPILYEKGQLFDGIQTNIKHLSTRDNLTKIMRRVQLQQAYEENKKCRRTIDKLYSHLFNLEGNYSLKFSENIIQLNTPNLFSSGTGFCNKIPFIIDSLIPINKTKWDIVLSYRFETVTRKPITNYFDIKIPYGSKRIDVPIYAPKQPGKYFLKMKCYSKLNKQQIESILEAWIFE